MQFNSYVFILLFLPLVVIGYFLSNKINDNAGKMCLVIFSIIFYVYGGWKLALILAASIITNFSFVKGMQHFQKQKKLILGISIALNVLVLFYVKYYNFFLDNVNRVLNKDFTLRHMILPLGISFFTFQQIMYLVAVYREELEVVSCLDYVLYILYFPKLIMGPVTEPKFLFEQLNNHSLKKINLENIAYGIKIFSFGLFKKLVIADTFASAVKWGFSNIENTTSMEVFLLMLCYTFEIYFDFSGYSDMAVGASLMLNIRLPMNFNSPYKATTVRDFWKSWHMSVTGFLTKYIYIPLGGSRKGEFRTYLNTMVVFIVSGIWHGANWTFILWGAIHGMLSVLERLFDKVYGKVTEVFRWILTFWAVNILWLLFRAESVGQWKSLLCKMFSLQDMSVSKEMLANFELPELEMILQLTNMNFLNSNIKGFSMVLFFVVAFVICMVPENNYNKLKENTWITMILGSIAFVWAFLCLSSESVFVYFDF